MNTMAFTSSKEKIISYFPAILIASLTLIPRLALWLSTKSLWGDEWFSINLAQKSISEILTVEILTDTHPPVYPLLLSVWIRIFGFSELSFRALSQVANMLIVFGSYGVANELFGKKVAYWSALFVAISPYFLHLSNEIRSYSVLTCISTFATFYFLKALNNPSRLKWKICYVLLAAATVYTEHYGWLWLFCISTYLLYRLTASWEQHKEWIWVQGFVFILGVPSVVMILHHALHNEEVLMRDKIMSYRNFASTLKKGFGIYWHFVCGPIYSMLTIKRVTELARNSWAFWLSFVLTISWIGLCLRSLLDFYRNRRDLLYLFIPLLVFPVFFLLIVYPIRLDSRYLCWSAPLFLTLSCSSILTLKWRVLRRSLMSFFLISSLMSNLYIIQIPTDPKHKEDYREMLRYSYVQSGDDDIIAGAGALTSYYSTRVGIQPNGVFFHSLSEAMVAMRKKQFDRLWTMHYINMKPEINEQILSKIDERLSPFGYVRDGKLLRFGGIDALTAIQMYKKNTLKTP